MKNEVLQVSGLTSNEIQIFLCLVKSGASSATDIAKHTGLNRPYIYYAIERLLEKGFISQITEHSKRKFRIISLKQILHNEEEKFRDLSKYLEELRKIEPSQEEDISVEVLKGRYVVKNIFKRILSDIKPKQEFLIIGVDEEKMEEFEPVYAKKLLNHYERNKITERVLIRKGGKKLEYAKTTKYKHLSEELIGNTVKFIYQDTVIEIIYGSPVYAIIIKNKPLAETAKKQFEVFWRIGKA